MSYLCFSFLLHAQMLLRLAVCIAMAGALNVDECLDSSVILKQAKDELLAHHGHHDGAHYPPHPGHERHGPRHRDMFSAPRADGRGTVLRLAHRLGHESGEDVDGRVKELMETAEDCDKLLSEMYVLLRLMPTDQSDTALVIASPPDAPTGDPVSEKPFEQLEV